LATEDLRLLESGQQAAGLVDRGLQFRTFPIPRASSQLGFQSREILHREVSLQGVELGRVSTEFLEPRDSSAKTGGVEQHGLRFLVERSSGLWLSELPANVRSLGLEPSCFDAQSGVAIVVGPLHPGEIRGHQAEVGRVIRPLRVPAEVRDEAIGAVGIVEFDGASEGDLVQALDPAVLPTSPELPREVREAMDPIAVVLVVVLACGHEDLEHGVDEHRWHVLAAQDRVNELLSFVVVLSPVDPAEGDERCTDVASEGRDECLDRIVVRGHLRISGEVAHDAHKDVWISICCSVNFHASSNELFHSATTVRDDVSRVTPFME